MNKRKRLIALPRPVFRGNFLPPFEKEAQYQKLKQVMDQVRKESKS